MRYVIVERNNTQYINVCCKDHNFTIEVKNEKEEKNINISLNKNIISKFAEISDISNKNSIKYSFEKKENNTTLSICSGAVKVYDIYIMSNNTLCITINDYYGECVYHILLSTDGSYKLEKQVIWGYSES